MTTAYVVALHTHPIKSCRAINVNLSGIDARGLDGDRRWMIVDHQGRFVTQRERPTLARVDIAIDRERLAIRHPAMPDLFVYSGDPKRRPESPTVSASIWGERLPALDAGEEAAWWFAELLGAPHRLVQFDDAVQRASDTAWTGPDIALNRFSDGIPVLVANQSSLDDLNARMVTPLPMNRFRPNIVLGGLDPWDEDHIRAIHIGNITLRLVKPCTRCVITTTDQSTAERSEEPLATLARFRADPRMNGAITFGQNAVPTGALPGTIQVGMRCDIDWNFRD